ncbi:MAG: hypothetical protein MJE68_30850 [Proteobacteria bacterium]|nr:hypothetical protein [Pseudomonadota bacterium]
MSEQFISGMLETLPRDIGGNVDMEVPEKLKYQPSTKYGKDADALLSLAKKMQLRNGLAFQKVQRQLSQLLRKVLDTRADYNSAIRVVLLQLHYPKRVKSDTVRHQIAAHMVQSYDFYYPKMRNYLKTHKLSFSAYIMHIFKGNIWFDEFILGAFGRMFDIKISIISPYYDDIWNIFHDSGMPHVVIVSNGSDIGRKHGPTHFSATMGEGEKWDCVGAHLNVGEMGRWEGYEEGSTHARDAFYMKEHYALMKKGRKMGEEIEELCQDMYAICIRRDQIYKEMEEMNLKVDAFKRFDTFYYATSKTESTHKRHEKHKETRRGGTSEPTVSKQDKGKKSAKSCGAFPKQLGAKLLSDAISEIDKETDFGDLPSVSTAEEPV